MCKGCSVRACFVVLFVENTAGYVCHAWCHSGLVRRGFCARRRQHNMNGSKVFREREARFTISLC